jgi:uncharacterized protein (DUF1330 family)
MNAYVIVDIDVHDPTTYEEYRRIAPPSIAAYGGRYLSRAGHTEVLEGEWVPKRLVVLEFPSLERAKSWIDSTEYRDARAMRHRAARTNMVVIEGTASPV